MRREALQLLPECRTLGSQHVPLRLGLGELVEKLLVLADSIGEEHLLVFKQARHLKVPPHLLLQRENTKLQRLRALGLARARLEIALYRGHVRIRFAHAPLECEDPRVSHLELDAGLLHLGAKKVPVFPQRVYLLVCSLADLLDLRLPPVELLGDGLAGGGHLAEGVVLALELCRTLLEAKVEGLDACHVLLSLPRLRFQLLLGDDSAAEDLLAAFLQA
mmetsp:Transcript_22205/g.53270  ORF Transcript_22205/g.53270 Transcript_22205/m.53270 type:complete len:219 (+) Transcript_22205:1044-1700(+)